MFFPKKARDVLFSSFKSETHIKKNKPSNKENDIKYQTNKTKTNHIFKKIKQKQHKQIRDTNSQLVFFRRNGPAFSHQMLSRLCPQVEGCPEKAPKPAPHLDVPLEVRING